jgi:uncharacterized protein (DUF433 family)
MKDVFENNLELGNGIYTIREIAHILPYQKVHLWVNKYWDGELGCVHEKNYSWTVGTSKAVGFHTLVEFYVMVQFAEAGVKSRQLLNAHKELSTSFKTPFPFAQKAVLEGIKTDGKTIYLSLDGNTITLDGTRQLNLNFIKVFFKKLEFDDELLVSRFWPLGKNHKIVCDPHHRFGQPIVDGTNIQAEAIFRMYLAKEPMRFIADLYEIDKAFVKDAILFYQRVA